MRAQLIPTKNSPCGEFFVGSVRCPTIYLLDCKFLMNLSPPIKIAIPNTSGIAALIIDNAIGGIDLNACNFESELNKPAIM